MSKARVVVHESLTAEEARRTVLSLLAMGLEAEAHRARHHGPTTERPAGAATQAGSGPSPPGSPAAAFPAAPSPAPDSFITWQVSVAEDEVPEALSVIEDSLAAQHEAPRPTPALHPFGDPSAGIWTARHAASSIAIVVVCVAIHLVVHQGTGPASRSAMIEAGAVAPWLVSEGQWWRLLSGVFLHFDLKHLVGNTSALLFLGPPLASQIGHLRMTALFLATGVAGNVVSQLLGDEAAIKAGASGGICGLLGALAGVAIGAMAAATDSQQRRPAWQTLGALVALFGMIVGFEPGRDHYAHVGGLVAGILLGRVLGLHAARRPA